MIKKPFSADNGLLPMCIGLISGLYYITFQITGMDLAFFPGDMGDGRLNLYFLEHAHKFFLGQTDSFWNAPFMYPESNTLAYSENLAGSAPLYSIFRLFGSDIFTSYQGWYIVVTSLNYISAFYLLREVFKNNHAAVLGAFVFAFSMALQSQLTHAQTFPRFAIPLAWLMAIKFSRDLKPLYFFLTLFFVVYQMYCGIYLGFMLAVPVAVFFVMVFFRNKNRIKQNPGRNNRLVKNALSVLANLLILLPLLLPYMERKIPPDFGHYKQISNTIPTFTSHLFSQRGSLIWNFLSKTGAHYNAWWDHQIFAGGIATFCLIFVILKLLIRLFKTRFNFTGMSVLWQVMFSGLITFFLYLRFSHLSAYLLVYFLPGYSAMRSITRIINIELIFFAVSTSFIATGLFNRKRKYNMLFFLAALALLVFDNYFIAENTYRTKKEDAVARMHSVDSVFACIPENSVVSYEPVAKESAALYSHLDAMLSSQRFNHQTINAYTATCPGDYAGFWHDPDEESRNYWLQDKKMSFDTLYVIKHPGKIEKISRSSIQNSTINSEKEKDKLKDLINYIRTDKKWMKQIEKKARKKGISKDSMLLLDARWVIDNE